MEPVKFKDSDNDPDEQDFSEEEQLQRRKSMEQPEYLRIQIK